MTDENIVAFHIAESEAKQKTLDVCRSFLSLEHREFAPHDMTAYVEQRTRLLEVIQRAGEWIRATKQSAVRISLESLRLRAYALNLTLHAHAETYTHQTRHEKNKEDIRLRTVMESIFPELRKKAAP